MREKIELTVEPIWERQPGETNNQYMWFTRYKESKLNGGSFRELCTRFNRKASYITMLQFWSSRNRWTARVEAYRDYLEKEKEERKLASFDEMNNRHLKSSTLLQNIFASWLSTNRDKIETLKPETALRFFDVGVKLERLAVSAAHGLGGEETRLIKQAKSLVTPDGEFDMVDVQEFVESKYYMGQKDAVRPKIMEKLWELFHGEHAEDKLEVVLGGGIGWGKSFMAEMGLAYMLYKLSRYPSPQEEFGLAPGSSMYFIMQSVKQELAKKVLFGQFAQRLQRSEYFCKNFPFDKSIMSELRFPNNITILPLSSSDTSALGLNVFGGCFPAEQEYVLSDGTLAKLGDCRTECVLTVRSPEIAPCYFASAPARAIPTGEKWLVRLHLSNGARITCTPDQRFKLASGEWLAAEHLSGSSVLFAKAPEHGALQPVVCREVQLLSVKAPVYDLEHVPDTHTFFVKAGSGFLLAHNCLDELNFMARVARPSVSRFTGEIEYDQAETLYTTVVRRMKSRFNDKGRVPGKLFLISSANYPGDFIDRKIKEAEAEIAAKGRSNIFVVRFPQWGTFPPDRLSPERFLVEVGDETRNSRIIESLSEATSAENVIEVPMDYRSDFEADIEAAIRDFAGIPVGGVSAFIKRREAIERSTIIHKQLHDGQQLFVTDAVDISQYAGRLNSLLNTSYLEQYAVGHEGFCVSVDLALSGDSCGFAIGHFEGFKSVGKSTVWDEESKHYIEKPAGEEPVIVIDGVLEIVPPKVDQIDINLVGDLIELLNARLSVDAVTADSFQSAALLQRMRKLRNLKNRQVRAGMLSVDTSLAPYMTVKQALQDERLALPDAQKLKKELRELILDDRAKKIDHPADGSKDMSDAVAAATYIISLRNARKTLQGTVGRKILAGIDATTEETASKRPHGRGHRVYG